MLLFILNSRALAMSDIDDEDEVYWVDDSREAISKGFLEYFALLEDPRMINKTDHSLLEIIFISVCAYICGFNSWEGVFEFAQARESWLKKYIELKNGIPSRVTYWRTFVHLNPGAFSNCFRNWIYTLLGDTKHIAIDGKTLKGVHDPNNPDASLILVSAWATDKSLLLGQIKTDIKSNEITAIPRLLDIICVKNCLISIDAIGCQTEIAKKIVDFEGDYLLALKENQGILRTDIETFFQGALESRWEYIDYESCESLEKGHGRIDTRKVYLVRDMHECIDTNKWPRLSSIVMVISSRLIKDRKTTETRYYITSSPVGVTEIALAIRKHWSIENELHWSLDVGFREDRQVAQKMNLAENLATLRRIAFTHLKKDSSSLSIENKRLKAAMCTDYLEQVLGI
jgi:predicted transposase YbfD/YdcC